MTLHRRLSPLLLCLAAVLAPALVRAQADPFWLRSWDAALATRPDELASSATIAPAGEPGTPLAIDGQIFGPDGSTPAAGVIVLAYHRDDQGFDFGKDDRETTAWRLHAWAKTDAQGRFAFRTIRPAPDFMGRDAAHVHFTLDSPAFGRQWAPIVYLADDARVSERARRESEAAGEFGWVLQVGEVDGVQRIAPRLRLKPKGEF